MLQIDGSTFDMIVCDWTLLNMVHVCMVWTFFVCLSGKL